MLSGLLRSVRHAARPDLLGLLLRSVPRRRPWLSPTVRNALVALAAGHGRWREADAPSARAASLASSAALPTPRTTASPGPARGWRPLRESLRAPVAYPSTPLARIAPARPPSGGVERPRRMVRFTRLIHRRGRWWLLSVVPHCSLVGRPSPGLSQLSSLLGDAGSLPGWFDRGDCRRFREGPCVPARGEKESIHDRASVRGPP